VGTVVGLAHLATLDVDARETSFLDGIATRKQRSILESTTYNGAPSEILYSPRLTYWTSRSEVELRQELERHMPDRSRWVFRESSSSSFAFFAFNRKTTPETYITVRRAGPGVLSVEIAQSRSVSLPQAKLLEAKWAFERTFR
jgi:hypothetical protein